MGKNSVKYFFEQMKANDEMEKAFARLNGETGQKWESSMIELGRNYGYTFSQEDLKMIQEKRLEYTHLNQMSETDLEQIAGGVQQEHPICSSDKKEIGKIVPFYVNQKGLL